MSDLIKTVRIPAPSPRGAYIEVELVSRPPPSKWRRWISLLLMRIAARISSMRVRVVR